MTLLPEAIGASRQNPESRRIFFNEIAIKILKDDGFLRFAQIVKLIKNYCPDQLSMPFYLWTRESVGLLIKKKFNILLSKWTVGRYLAKWGFSPQKPARRAIEQNPKAIKN